MAHHDQYHYGDGRILYASLEARSHEATSTVLGGILSTEIDDITYADTINEVDAHGKLVWQWKASERLPRDQLPLLHQFTRDHCPLITSGFATRDGKHVIALLRSASSVIIIEESTGDIVWKVGPDTLVGQHNATEQDSGNILVFDNGNGRRDEFDTFIRAIELDRATGEIVW
jgi:hypothetical protein